MCRRAPLSSFFSSSPRTTVPHSQTMTLATPNTVQVVRDLDDLVRAPAECRVQLCGPLVVRMDGRDVAGSIRGRQGRIVFAYLLLNRTRQVTRRELTDTVWGSAPPPEPAVAVRALLSKLRATLDATGVAALPTGDSLRLHLPPDAEVDVEVAVQALHDAQSAVSGNEDVRAWIAAHIALNVSSRVFLEGVDGEWIAERRAALHEIRLRALEALSACALRLGGPEVNTAVRTARELIRLAPFRETGHAHLMKALAAQGNLAEAVLTYEKLRVLLREELGIDPAPELRALHTQLIKHRSIGKDDTAREGDTRSSR
jgi:SARP family transcriptional regulator, regulator of embCAB operon